MIPNPQTSHLRQRYHAYYRLIRIFYNGDNDERILEALAGIDPFVWLAITSLAALQTVPDIEAQQNRFGRAQTSKQAGQANYLWFTKV